MKPRGRYTVRAVVVGAGINGLGVLRSLARAGVPVVIVDSTPDAPGMHSRYGRKKIYARHQPGALMETLGALADERADEKAVLILTEEETVADVAARYSEVTRRFHLTMPPPDALMPLLNKDGIRAIAQAIGAHVPRTLRIQNSEQIGDIDALRLPIVLKPAVRDIDYARTFKKAYRIYDRSKAYELLTRMLPVLADIVVQEWIEGTDSDLYFCLQYIAPDGYSKSFVGRKIRSWPPRVGGTASCVSAPEASAIAGVTSAFFREAGVTGLASMEYKYDRLRGEYVIIEPTVGRTDFQEEVATLNGINLPLIAYCRLLGYALPAPARAGRAVVWREHAADVQSAEQTPVEDTREPAESRRVNALWRLSDPGPAGVVIVKRLRARFERIVAR